MQVLHRPSELAAVTGDVWSAAELQAKNER
jgi:hypothetical protein